MAQVNIQRYVVTGRKMGLNKKAVVKLTPEQAKTRMHCLTPITGLMKPKGLYEVTGLIEFKRGEEIGIDITTTGKIPVSVAMPSEVATKAAEKAVRKIETAVKKETPETKIDDEAKDDETVPDADDPTADGRLSR